MYAMLTHTVFNTRDIPCEFLLYFVTRKGAVMSEQTDTQTHTYTERQSLSSILDSRGI